MANRRVIMCVLSSDTAIANDTSTRTGKPLNLRRLCILDRVPVEILAYIFELSAQHSHSTDRTRQALVRPTESSLKTFEHIDDGLLYHEMRDCIQKSGRKTGLGRNDGNGGAGGLPSQVVVSHVCVRWRAIAMKIPVLWNRLELDMRKVVKLRMAEEWLVRTKNAPLDVFIDCDYSGPNAYGDTKLLETIHYKDDEDTLGRSTIILRNLLRLLQPHVSRLRTFDMLANFEGAINDVLHVFSVGVCLERGAPILERLRLHLRTTFTPARPRFELIRTTIPFGGILPRLRHIDINVEMDMTYLCSGDGRDASPGHDSLSSGTVPAAQLTNLTFLRQQNHVGDNLNETGFLEIIRLTRQLEVLTLINHDSITSAAVIADLDEKPPISLPHLWFLKLANMPPKEMTPFVLNTYAPNLSQLCLETADRPFDKEDTLAFLNALCRPIVPRDVPPVDVAPGASTPTFVSNVSAFTLSCAQGNHEVAENLFNAMPKLQQLSIKWITTPRCYLHYLSKCQSVCPLLSTLALSFVDEEYFVDLMCLLRSRKTAGRPLEQIAVTLHHLLHSQLLLLCYLVPCVRYTVEAAPLSYEHFNFFSEMSEEGSFVEDYETESGDDTTELEGSSD